MKKNYLLLLAIISFGIPTSAQLNIKAGYLGFYGQFDKTNEVFSTFNQNNELSKSFREVHYLQGIDIGLRYRWNNIGFEGGWSHIQSRKNEALGDDFQDDWKISSSEFYVALENYFGAFGFGASLGYNTIRYKTNIPGSRDDQTIIKDNILSSKIYVFTHVTSGKTGISIKPFYMPKWGRFDIGDFNNVLNNSGSPINEYLSGFGFTLVLYNGPQD